jgi:hypothetical protein
VDRCRHHATAENAGRRAALDEGPGIGEQGLCPFMLTAFDQDGGEVDLCKGIFAGHQHHPKTALFEHGPARNKARIELLEAVLQQG